MAEPLLVRVAIPHFFREGPGTVRGTYGSGRPGNRLARSISLGRCLGSVLGLGRDCRDWILNIAERHLELSPITSLRGLAGVRVELHLFTCGDHCLSEVVDLFAPRLQWHRLELADPRQLPLEAVRWLLSMQPAPDLCLYLEDDLVLADPRYLDKLAWFYERTDHRFVLMPHRLEPSVANAPRRLFVDGPIKPRDQQTPVWAGEEALGAEGRFWDGQQISFVEASNPHSGTFCLSRPQLATVCASAWPPPRFIGPLETAATGIVLPHFPVLKPSWACRDFLSIEHANPSFLGLMAQLPRRVS